MDNKKINIAIVGLGFGAEFIPIYQKHTRITMNCSKTRMSMQCISIRQYRTMESNL